MLSQAQFLHLFLLLLPMSEVVVLNSEAYRSGRYARQVILSQPIEVGMLDTGKPIVTSCAEESADCAGEMVVIDHGFGEWLRATGAQALLLIDKGIELLNGHAIPVEASAQGAQRVPAEQVIDDAIFNALFAAGRVPIQHRGRARERREGLDILAGSAGLFANGRFGQYLDFELTHSDRQIAASLALSGDAKPITWIGVEVAKVLIDPTDGTDFHSMSLPQGS